MDAIRLLKQDHRTVEALFKQFEKLEDDAKDDDKKAIVDEIIKELSVHASIEEQVFYPAARRAFGKDGEDQVLEALEEHHVAKWLLSELDSMSPSAERYDAKVTVLMENIRHHVKEEEEELFVHVEKAIDAEALATLGGALEAARKLAPTHPHPSAPDSPPGNLVAGVGAGLLDKARDFVIGAAKRAGKRVASAGSARTRRVKATIKTAPRAEAARVSRAVKSVEKAVAKKLGGKSKGASTKAASPKRRKPAPRRRASA